MLATAKARLEVWPEGHRQHGRRVFDCLCPDGVRRTAKITGEPRRFGDYPAHVKVTVRGAATTVTGTVAWSGGDWRFTEAPGRRNAAIFAP